MSETRQSIARNDSCGNARIDNAGSIKTKVPLIRFVQFELKHLDDIIRRDKTRDYGKLRDQGYFANVEKGKQVFAGINKRGEAIAIGGITEFWPGRGEAWMILTLDTKAEFMRLHRYILNFLNSYPGRVECVVSVNFTQGRRWVKMLGFQVESIPMKKYFPNGDDAFLYSRIS